MESVMNTQEVAGMLQECLRLVEAGAVKPTEEARANYLKSKEALPEELSTLLAEAADMRWPFVEERWQYKHSVSCEDKVNTSDLIKQHLPQLLKLLQAFILAGEAMWAASVIFLLDRFLYLIDSSHTLLQIAKALHKMYPATPIAPQLIIRRARLYLNSGKLQKAEYILSSLIANNGTTGCWNYQNEKDRILVQAVSIQVRGQVLQKLGLWLEAAELIWVSLIGFYVLPHPDKKGIGTSLGLLANILVSINDEDFQKIPHIDLSFLGKSDHRLLSAAQAAKMAVVYSQYGPLFVLTNVVTQGTCLLSYSFSKECPPSEKKMHLILAKEAFEVGLLTKKEGEMVTSKQEMHTLLKGAYCLAVTHRWLSGPSELVDKVVQVCQNATAMFYVYCFSENSDKDTLGSKIMHEVQSVKSLLKVEQFPTSDKRSFVPDTYRAMEEICSPFSVEDFSKEMEKFEKHHIAVSQTYKAAHKKRGGGIEKPTVTAFGTWTETLECITESHPSSSWHKVWAEHKSGVTELRGSDQSRRYHDSHPLQQNKSRNDSGSLHSKLDLIDLQEAPKRNKEARTSTSSLGGNLGSSWYNVSSLKVGSPQSRDSFEILDSMCRAYQKCPTISTEEDGQGSPFEHLTHGPLVDFISPKKQANPNNYSSSISPLQDMPTHMKDHEIPKEPLSEEGWKDQSSIETEDDPELSYLSKHLSSLADVSKDIHQTQRSKQSSFGSFSDSFSSNSSWQKLYLSDASSLPKSSGKPFTKDSATEQSAIAQTQGEQQSTVPHHVPEVAPQPGKPCECHQIHPETQGKTVPFPSTENDSYEFLEFAEVKLPAPDVPSMDSPVVSSCNRCFKDCTTGSELLTKEDYQFLLAGVCQDCLTRRLPKNTFQLKEFNKSYCALVLKYSKATGQWTGCETNVYIGEKLGEQGAQRHAFRVQYLHQESLLSSYVGKDYHKEAKQIHIHLSDVEKQMTAQYYVTEFNKRLYERNETTQIFFIPSEVLLILDGGAIIGCLSVEPYMMGKFVKLTNNTDRVEEHRATEYGIAFGHFTYEFSNGQEIVVDLQGWVTGDGKGLTYLTDPQIHSNRKPRSGMNFSQTGIWMFQKYQHGPECNTICRRLSLRELK